MSRDLSCTRPNFAGGRSRPQAGALFTLTQIAGHQTGACLPLRRLQDTKQAPVYPYADCRAPNRRLFTLTQIAGHQTDACLPLRRLQDAKQAPVYPYADCRTPNRRLFTITQIAGPQTGACLPLRRPLPRPRKSILVPAKLRCPRRGPVWLLSASFLRVLIHGLDLGGVATGDGATTELEGVGQFAVLDGEGALEEGETLDLLERGEMLLRLFDE